MRQMQAGCWGVAEGEQRREYPEGVVSGVSGVVVRTVELVGVAIILFVVRGDEVNSRAHPCDIRVQSHKQYTV